MTFKLPRAPQASKQPFQNDRPGAQVHEQPRTKKARPLFPNHLVLSPQTNLTELKSFGAPPPAVSNVSAAVMTLTAPGGRVPKDRSWKAAKVTMAKVDGFLDSLINFDKENIPESCLKAIRPYLQDPEFRPEFVATKSYAAAGLCSWVINIVRFYEVFCDVEPKRQALSRATADLTAAQENLAAIKAKIAVSEAGAPPATPARGAASGANRMCPHVPAPKCPDFEKEAEKPKWDAKAPDFSIEAPLALSQILYSPRETNPADRWSYVICAVLWKLLEASSTLWFGGWSLDHKCKMARVTSFY